LPDYVQREKESPNEDGTKEMEVRKSELEVSEIKSLSLDQTGRLDGINSYIEKSNEHVTKDRIEAYKIEIAALEKEKPKMKPIIKQSIIDDFEKAY
jgi:hypothetical protein